MVTIGLHNPASFSANSHTLSETGAAFITVAIDLGGVEGRATIFIRNLQQAKDLAYSATHAVVLAEEAFKEEKQ